MTKIVELINYIRYRSLVKPNPEVESCFATAVSYIPSQSQYKQVAFYTSGENHVSLRVIGSPAVPATLTNLTNASLADLNEYCKDKVWYSGFIAYFCHLRLL